MLNVILNNKHLNSLEKNKPVVLALSGGVDSMVLFSVLISANYKVVIAHVNHHKRSESQIEQEYIKQLSIENNCPFEVLDFYHEKENFQAEAHKKRYEFFINTAKKYNASCIITAHHYMDNLETILMNILRGSNLYGYGGINEAVTYDGFMIIRPFINSYKEDIYKYAHENNVKYFEDSSNSSDDYLRNRIRHHVIPLLEKENPSLKSSVTNFSSQLHEAFDYIRTSSVNYLTEHDGKIEINSFNNLALIIKKDIINYICEQNKILSTDNKINDILKLIENPKPNLSYDLNNEYIFVKAYDKCYVSTKTDKTSISFTINKNEQVEVMGFTTFQLNESINSETYLKISSNEPLPLHIRTRCNGDRLIIGDGHKKLKDFLIDKKVPKEKRDNLLIVTNNLGEIIWVIGYYKKKCDEPNGLILSFKEKIYEC